MWQTHWTKFRMTTKKPQCCSGDGKLNERKWQEFVTVAPLAVAALAKVVQVPAGSIVPSFGTYNVPYRSLTFIRGYRSLVSAGDRTWDSMPYTLPSWGRHTTGFSNPMQGDLEFKWDPLKCLVFDLKEILIKTFFQLIIFVPTWGAYTRPASACWRL